MPGQRVGWIDLDVTVLDNVLELEKQHYLAARYSLLGHISEDSIETIE
jgi:hypothetical protein